MSRHESTPWNFHHDYPLSGNGSPDDQEDLGVSHFFSSAAIRASSCWKTCRTALWILNSTHAFLFSRIRMSRKASTDPISSISPSEMALSRSTNAMYPDTTHFCTQKLLPILSNFVGVGNSKLLLDQPDSNDRSASLRSFTHWNFVESFKMVSHFSVV